MPEEAWRTIGSSERVHSLESVSVRSTVATGWGIAGAWSWEMVQSGHCEQSWQSASGQQVSGLASGCAGAIAGSPKARSRRKASSGR